MLGSVSADRGALCLERWRRGALSARGCKCRPTLSRGLPASLDPGRGSRRRSWTSAPDGSPPVRPASQTFPRCLPRWLSVQHSQRVFAVVDIVDAVAAGLIARPNNEPAPVFLSAVCTAICWPAGVVSTMLPSPPLVVMMLPFGASTIPSGSFRCPPSVSTVPPLGAAASGRASGIARSCCLACRPRRACRWRRARAPAGRAERFCQVHPGIPSAISCAEDLRRMSFAGFEHDPKRRSSCRSVSRPLPRRR